jgi:WD40 repeat protein
VRQHHRRAKHSKYNFQARQLGGSGPSSQPANQSAEDKVVIPELADSQMDDLWEMLHPCDENTLRVILVELCVMFQRDYLNVPKLHEGKLRIEHVENIVRNAYTLAKQRLTGDDKGEHHTGLHKGTFVVNAVPNLFHGRSPDMIAHLNHLMQRCSEGTLQNMVVWLCESLQEDGQDCLVEGPDEIKILDIESVISNFYDALTDALHTVLLQQDTDRRAFAVVQGTDQNAEAPQHQPAKAGGRKQTWTGLLSVSADILALVSSFLAREEVRVHREWQTAISGREDSGHEYSQYSPCGNFVLTYSETCVKLWHATSGRAKISIEGHAGPVTICCFYPDGKAIVSASDDNTLKVWNADSGSLVRTLEGHTDGIMCVDVSCDSTRILSAGGDNTVKLWNANTGEIQHTVQFDDRVLCTLCSFSPDSTMFVVGLVPMDSGGKHVLILFNTKTDEIQRTLEGHKMVITSCSFAPNGTAILSGSQDSTMKLWCVTTGQLLRTLEGHTNEIHACAFSPSGMNIISASRDGTLRLWAVSTGQQQTIDADLVNAIDAFSASFSPDGKYILGSYTDGTVKTWRYHEKAGLIQG